jgi:hypothetical protein
MINRNYPYLNWILTIIIGPFLWIIYEILINEQNAGSMFEVIFAFIGVGLIFSLPSLAINVFVFQLLIKITSSLFLIKFILISIGVIGIIVTFKLIGGTLALNLTLSYSISLIIAGLLIRLQNEQNLINKEN